MARITIEDCMEKVPNRFQLVQMAAIRAKQLKKGARPLLSSEENKDVVMSLREIAAGLVKPGDAAPPTETAHAPPQAAPSGEAEEAAAPVGSAATEGAEATAEPSSGTGVVEAPTESEGSEEPAGGL